MPAKLVGMDWVKIIGITTIALIAVAYAFMFYVTPYWIAVDLLLILGVGWLLFPKRR